MVAIEGTPRLLVDAGPGAFLRIGVGPELRKSGYGFVDPSAYRSQRGLASSIRGELTSEGAIAYRILARTARGDLPKHRALYCWWEMYGAFAYQETFGAQECFGSATWRGLLDSPPTKISSMRIAGGGRNCDPSWRRPVGGLPDFLSEQGGGFSGHGYLRRKIWCDWRRMQIC